MVTYPPICNATLCMHGVLLSCKRLLRNISECPVLHIG